MSYDLFFTSPSISLEHFQGYFSGNSRYEVSNGQAFYSNKTTGVYFIFEHNAKPSEDPDDIAHSAVFNLNYYRPHYFALEAEPEVRRFIDHFHCTIHDYQDAGMGDGPYSREGFLKGWNHGNQFGYNAILTGKNAPSLVYSKSTSELDQIWKWNDEVDRRQAELSEDIFIPRIFFVTVNGTLGSVCIWPDGISTLIPATDYLYIPRKELAPKSWLGKVKEDFCILERDEYFLFLETYQVGEFGLRAYKLPCLVTPKEIKEFVRKLKPFVGDIVNVAADSVLNQEIVSIYKG